jgi:uncharacterized protein YjbI with pentapeptide repeats
VSPEDRRSSDDVAFAGRRFQDADFRDWVFEGRVDLSDCVFTGRADFSGAVFKGRVFFARAVFENGADFHEAVFERFANFEDIKVAGEARFTGAAFDNGLTVENAVVDGELKFNRAHFEKTSRMGPVRAEKVDFRLVVFLRRVRLEIIADHILCERAGFYEGVQFLLDRADLVLKDSELGPASLLATYTARRERSGPSTRPRLITVSGTDVFNLSVSRADLSACKFIYAHNLDKLRVNVDDAFGWAPRSLWFTRRQITGDERRWRIANARRRRNELWRPSSSWPHIEPPKNTSEVVESYRALRKSREEARDEPGAADFYYGEMEMRRIGTRLLAREERRARRWRGWLVARAEYALLWLYWALSGYGLRAWRAFAAFAVVIAVTAAAFLTWGYPPGQDATYADSVRFSLRAATSILRGPEQRLTPAGEWIELVLRFTGPVLFGLALLALRGRVKR